MLQALYFLGVLVGISGTALYYADDFTERKVKMFHALCITAIMLIPTTFLHLLLIAWEKI